MGSCAEALTDWMAACRNSLLVFYALWTRILTAMVCFCCLIYSKMEKAENSSHYHYYDDDGGGDDDYYYYYFPALLALC